jgi:hypothetical protein
MSRFVLVHQTREWLKDDAERERAAYLMGATPVWLLEHATSGNAVAADRLAELIEGNVGHPARDADPWPPSAERKRDDLGSGAAEEKGSNLCHGTGGNGYAFLKLFKRTGDARCCSGRAPLPCTASGRRKHMRRSTGACATRCGLAIRALPCTCGTASEVGRRSRHWTCSEPLERGSKFRAYRKKSPHGKHSIRVRRLLGPR